MMHDIIQVVMRWWDYHLYEFEIGDRLLRACRLLTTFSSERKVYKASGLRLATVLERGIREFLYVYDFRRQLAASDHRP